MSSAFGSVCFPHDLAGVVECVGNATFTTESAEIDHPALLRPGEGVLAAAARFGSADDLARAIDSGGGAPTPAEGAQVDRTARLRPREGVVGAAARVGFADDLARVVHGLG